MTGYGRKRPAQAAAYRSGYLRSAAWLARRDAWLRHEEEGAGGLACGVCLGPLERKSAELHHLDYAGVRLSDTGWKAGEAHADLIACHRRCHEMLHILLDRDQAVGMAATRHAANERAIAGVRRKLAALDKEARR